MRLILKIILFILLITSQANAATYYVNKTGNDTTGDGSVGSPWLTIKKALTTLTGTHTVSVGDGTYTEQQLVVPVGISITSTSAAVDKVYIFPVADMSVGFPLITLSSASPGTDGSQSLTYLNIYGNYAGINIARQGVLVQNQNNVTIDHCEIRDFTGVATTSNSTSSYGVTVQSTQAPYRSTADLRSVTYFVDENNDMRKSAAYPINPISGFTFTNNTVSGCGYNGGDGTLNANALFFYHLYDFTIEGNTIDHSHTATEAMEVTPGLWESGTFSNNVVICHTSGISGGTDTIWGIETWVLHDVVFSNNKMINAGFSTTWGNNVEWSYNYFDNSAAATTLWTIGIEARDVNNAKIHHNRMLGCGNTSKSEVFIVVGASNGCANGLTLNAYVWGNVGDNIDANGGIWVDNYNTYGTATVISNAYLTNNTLSDVTTPGGAIRINDSDTVTSNVVMKNNILYSSTTGYSAGGTVSLTSSNNLWYGNSTNSNPASVYTNDANKVITQPLFSDDLSPQSGGPQINTGIAIGTIDSIDMSQLLHSSTNWKSGLEEVPVVVLTDPSGNPDIGAYEYGGSVTDVTGPSISDKSPADGTVYTSGTTTANGDITVTDASGVAGCECSDAVFAYGAGTAMSNVSGDLYRCSITGLSDSTSYTNWNYRCRDTEANESSGSWSFAVASGTSDIIIDNLDTAFSVTGTWATSSATPGYYDQNYRHNNAVTTGTTATFNIASVLTYAGYYQLYEQHAAYSNRPDAAPHVLTHTEGETTIFVNQQTGGGQWNLLGTFYFSTSSGSLVIQGTDGGYTVADAIRLVVVEQEPEPPSAVTSGRSMRFGQPVGIRVSGDGNVARGN